MTLDKDVSKALQMMKQIDSIHKMLPGLDCGSCGSPSCRALAEDIVKGCATENDCIFILKDKIKSLAEELSQLAGKKLPVTK